MVQSLAVGLNLERMPVKKFCTVGARPHLVPTSARTRIPFAPSGCL